MPPILSEIKENIEVLEKDEMLSGFSTSKHLFIDISLGIPTRVKLFIRKKKHRIDFVCLKDRMILARDSDGTLRTATLDEQRRMRQIYFPVPGRELITPKMFEENQLEVKKRKKKENFDEISRSSLENFRTRRIRIHSRSSLCAIRAR